MFGDVDTDRWPARLLLYLLFEAVQRPEYAASMRTLRGRQIPALRGLSMQTSSVRECQSIITKHVLQTWAAEILRVVGLFRVSLTISQIGWICRSHHDSERLDTRQGCPEQEDLSVKGESILEIRPCYTVGFVEGLGFGQVYPAA